MFSLFYCCEPLAAAKGTWEKTNISGVHLKFSTAHQKLFFFFPCPFRGSVEPGALALFHSIYLAANSNFLKNINLKASISFSNWLITIGFFIFYFIKFLKKKISFTVDILTDNSDVAATCQQSKLLFQPVWCFDDSTMGDMIVQ